MPVTVAVVLVAGAAFLIRWAVGRRFARGRLVGGLEFVVLGLAMGPQLLGVISEEMIAILQPIVSFALGLLGFLLGLSIRHRFQSGWAAAAICSAVIVAGSVGAGLTLGINLSGISIVEPFWLALALAAMAAVSSERCIDLVCATVGARGPVTDLLHAIARISSVVAVAGFGCALAFFRASDAFDLSRAEWLLVAVAVGAVCGILYRLFIGRDHSEELTFLATIGVVIFASGLASGMGMSPLFVNMIAGLTVAALSTRADELSAQLDRLEPPLEVAILVFGGLLWSAPAGVGWLVAAAWVALRLGSLLFAPALALRLTSTGEATPRIGHGLFAEGPLVMAIAVNFAQISPPAANVALTAAILALFVTDILAAGALRRVIADAGEIRHAELLQPSEGQAP